MAPRGYFGTLSGVSDTNHGILTGPWVQAFWVEAELDLRSKSNFRRSHGSSTGRKDWERLARFEDDLGLILRSALPADWDLGEEGAPVATRPPVVAAIIAASLVDVANYPKSVIDAAEKVVFHTDASVVFCASAGIRVRQPHLTVAFARLSPGAGLTEALSAGAALVTAVQEALPESLID